MRFLDANVIIRYLTGDKPEVMDRVAERSSYDQHFDRFKQQVRRVEP